MQQAMTRRRLPWPRRRSAAAPRWAAARPRDRGPRGSVRDPPWPVDFLLIVSPLVTWIWLGAIIIALGGLIALWPVPVLARRDERRRRTRRGGPRRRRCPPASWPSRRLGMDFVIVLAILALVVLVVSAPFRRRGGRCRRDRLGRRGGGAFGRPEAGRAQQELGELEAAREAKYREIRDAELDHRTGKLSDADYEAIDRACGPRRSRSYGRWITPSEPRRGATIAGR